MPRQLWATGNPPTYPFTLNRRSPQFAGLRSLIVPDGAGVRDLLVPDTVVYNGNAAPAIAAEMGRCMTFDGTGDYITTGSPTALDNLTQGAMTATAWIRPASLSVTNDDKHNILGRWDEFDFIWFLGFRGDGSAVQLQATVDNSAYARSVFAFAAGGVYHVAVTYDNGGDKTPYLAINGQFAGAYAFQQAHSGSASSDAAKNFSIGGSGNNGAHPWNGQIGEIRLYNRVLGAGEIAQLWNPQTRWELYQPPKWRTIVQGAAAPAAPTVKTLAALGVG